MRWYTLLNMYLKYNGCAYERLWWRSVAVRTPTSKQTAFSHEMIAYSQKKKMNDTLICLRFRQKFWNRLFTYLTLAFLGWGILKKMKSNFSSFFTFLRANVFSIFHFFFHFKLKTSQITFPVTRSCSHYVNPLA